MISARRTHCASLQPLLDEAIALVEAQNWSCSVHHIFREANQCADILAGMGHNGSFLVSVIEPPTAEFSFAGSC